MGKKSFVVSVMYFYSTTTEYHHSVVGCHGLKYDDTKSKDELASFVNKEWWHCNFLFFENSGCYRSKAIHEVINEGFSFFQKVVWFSVINIISSIIFSKHRLKNQKRNSWICDSCTFASFQIKDTENVFPNLNISLMLLIA